MPRWARQGSQLFGCQKAASSGGLGRSLEHLDPAEEHLTLGSAAGQETASLSLSGCAWCGGDKAAKLFIKPFEMAGGCRPGQQLGVEGGGYSTAFWACLGGDLASCSSLLFSGHSTFYPYDAAA